MKKYAVILMMVVGFMAGRASGGGLTNDNFAGAYPLVLENGTVSVTMNNTQATKEAGEPNHAENAGGKSLWFSFTPTATKVFRINTMDTNFDTLLAVYTGNAVNNLQTIGYNDDCNSLCGASTVDLMLTAGTTYYIAVDGYNDNGSISAGNFKLVFLENDAPFQDNLLNNYNLGTSHSGSIAGTNYNATREANEPEHVNSSYPGARTVWYKWKPSGTFGASFELTENFDSQITVYSSPTQNPTFAQLTRVGWNIDSSGDYYSRYHVKFYAEMNKTYFIAVAGHSQNPQAGDAGNFQLKFKPFKMSYSMNLNPQRSRSAVSVYRPSEGNWYSLWDIASPNNYGIYKWGIEGDVPFAADFTGDGESERAVARNENGQKVWYIRTTPAPTIIQWGLASDKAVVGDFDFDSRADLTVIRNTANGYVWYVRQSLTGTMRTFTFGTTGDKPVLGDFDGDGGTEVAVVRNTPGGLVWYILKSGSNNYNGYTAVQFGTSPDVPAVEDFDGDGKTDIAVFRPSNGAWYIYQSGNGQVRIDAFGLSGDKPQPADYNGDGKADLAVFRPSTGIWYIAKPNGVPAQNFYAINWGISTDIPVSSLSTLSQ